jgi:hypothetical protein
MRNGLFVTLFSIVVVSMAMAGAQSKPKATKKEDKSARQDLGGITVKMPTGWKSVKPSSEFRRAQYVLPKVEGDSEDAELVVTNFGRGQGGGVEANIERWEGQFEPRGKAKVTKKKVGDIPVTIADISGTYKQQAMGGPFAGGEVTKKPNFRLLAAIVEAPDSSYFFKLTGPAKTITKWAKNFDEFIGSVQKK